MMPMHTAHTAEAAFHHRRQLTIADASPARTVRNPVLLRPQVQQVVRLAGTHATQALLYTAGRSSGGIIMSHSTAIAKKFAKKCMLLSVSKPEGTCSEQLPALLLAALPQGPQILTPRASPPAQRVFERLGSPLCRKKQASRLDCQYGATWGEMQSHSIPHKLTNLRSFLAENAFRTSMGRL